jgi:CRP-like cAMP-binding protein
MEKPACQVCLFKTVEARKLSDSELSTMKNNCTSVRFKPGDNIIRQNAMTTNIPYLTSGLVKIHVQGPSRERIRSLTKAPAYLCLPNSFAGSVNRFSVTALTESTVCIIDEATFSNFIRNNGTFALQIIHQISASELHSSEEFLFNSHLQHNGRLAGVLLYFMNELFLTTEFQLPLNRQELADLTGTTRESISRILSDFYRDEIIGIDHKTIRILDEKRLEQISKNG